jgi:hypothetical protein
VISGERRGRLCHLAAKADSASRGSLVVLTPAAGHGSKREDVDERR